jgi:phosphoserine phosphatase|eukprot:TRINITY_DN69610_c0_g1_i1.p1 TRINITY_DN69610_c0_g1~~TRINITY_DN69610_c0_g1_i1.p1  ORF type:complete len:870 (+),score=170.20 TRINITY_DN69610_c0_g1_i1:45-2612(+)
MASVGGGYPSAESSVALETRSENDATPTVLVIRFWGRDAPGLAHAIVKIAGDNGGTLLDMSQFLLEAVLMFTCVLRADGGNSMKMMQDMTSGAKASDLKLDFYAVSTDTVRSLETQDNMVSVSVVSPGPIAPCLLRDLDSVLHRHGCVVLDIQHRSDNKKANNGEYDKLQLRVASPAGLKLSSLCIASSAEGEAFASLQDAAWKHGAEIAVRWWDAMTRPNGKSLVVFGLSHVLCPYDVLDEVLLEACLNPDDAETDGGSQSVVNRRKVKMLKGSKAEVVQRVISRLIFTPSARLVCSTLKRMGCRLAILTNTGVREIADHVKRELDLDYVISRDLEIENGCFTGDYAGEFNDVSFRKADLLKLMAEREGISSRNVVVVGEFLKGLTASNARMVFETFGPNVWFRSTKLNDLKICLYLLGFNGSEVHCLPDHKKADIPEAVESVTNSRGGPFTIQVSSRTREAGQLQKIFEPMKAFASQLQVRTVRQCSLQDGGMCLGVELDIAVGAEDAIWKELLFAYQKLGLHIHEMGFQAKSSGCWKRRYRNRHVITMVQQPNIESRSLEGVLRKLSESKVNVVQITRLSLHGLNALQLIVVFPDGLDAKEFASELVQLSKQLELDIACQRDDLERWMRRLVVFDMDSTLIQQEVIDELAKIADVETKVKTITEAAMRGEIDFFDSLKQRVALLKGHNADQLFSKVKQNLVYTPGVERLCSTLKHLGFKMAVISGGFLPVAQEVKRYLELDYAFANTLEIDETNGLLTGGTSGPVVTPLRKRALLATIANVEGCDVSQTIAVGDGANDIPMLHTAGLGIAFCAKPKVQEVAEFRINQKDLSTVLFLIGVSEHAADKLAAEAR